MGQQEREGHEVSLFQVSLVLLGTIITTQLISLPQGITIYRSSYFQVSQSDFIISLDNAFPSLTISTKNTAWYIVGA